MGTAETALTLSFPNNVRHQKFRIKPFLKGLRESKEQSSLAGICLPYFRNCPRLLHPKNNQKMACPESRAGHLHI